MQGYPTSGSPVIVKNSPSSFLRRCDIGSSISTSSFDLKHTSKEKPIYLFWPSSNWKRKFFFPTTICTYPTTSFLVLLILRSLMIFSNYPTLDFTTDPTSIFVLVCFFISIPSLSVTTGDLMVYLGVGDNIKCSSKHQAYGWFFVCEKSFKNTHTHKQRIARTLRTNNSSLSESYHASLCYPPS